MDRFFLLLSFGLLLGSPWWSAAVQAQYVLNPPNFNLAEGRNITATATCGEEALEPELYCKLVGSNWLDNSKDNSSLIEGQACDYCDPRDENRAHPAVFAIDGTERWWQSPPLSRGPQYNEVNLTIDLGQEFHVAYVFIKMGNSPRPGVWILERSTDYGQSYRPWQYFADTPNDCIYFFGQLSLQPITKDDSVICETKFSKLIPLEGGEIAISLLNGRPNADNFVASASMQEWSTATNIRLRFLRPKTTLGHYLSLAKQDPTVTRRYFYSVKDINIGGRCVCNGHASQCDQASPSDPYKVSCSCQHNTCGNQCEQCCPGYRQYKWRRATLNDSFVCEKCNCNGHSEECYYDEEVEAQNKSVNIYGVNVGGGVCQNCQHNTAGINCDQCKDGYFRPIGMPLDAIDVCQQCRCDPKFSTGNCFNGEGVCECRKNYLAPKCDQCSNGYFNYPECEECHCYPSGTLNNTCELLTGDCPCRPAYAGKFCKECSANHYGFPDCRSCDCDPDNSIDNNCNVTSGQCTCKTNFGGRRCDECSVGYYNYPSCQFCPCDREGSERDICDRETGTCFCKEGFEGPTCSKCAPGYFGYPNCIKCDCNVEGAVDQTCDQSGRCKCKRSYSGYKCGDCSPGNFNFPKCEPCACYGSGASGISCDHSGNCICKDKYEGQKCNKCKEGYYNFPECEECNCDPAGLVAEFGGCDKMELGKLCECKDRVKGRICNQCKDLYWNLQMNNVHGCEECLCNPNGTISRIGFCDSATGQCNCKPNVQGRTCNTCRRNTYLLDSANLFGCIDCDCDIGGAVNAECDKKTGQCMCKPRIKGRKCSETIDGNYFPTFYQFIYEAEDWYNPASGSQARFDYNETTFPGYSWRGYATFNELQKEIYTNISIRKEGDYRIIVRYVNNNNEPVNGVLKFTSTDWMNEEPKNIPITFEPTSQPKILFVTNKQLIQKSVASLDPGPWRISLKVDRFNFLIDYVVLIPQAYYDNSLFQEKRRDACLYNSVQASCLRYRYPTLPETAHTLNAIDGYNIVEESEEAPARVGDDSYEEQLKPTSSFIKLDKERKTLVLDFKNDKNGTQSFILNYHTPKNLNRTIMLELSLVNTLKNTTTTSNVILSACPYMFICRQILAVNDGEMFLLEPPKDSLQPSADTYRLKLALTNDEDLNVESISLIPYNDKWSFDYVRPKLVCIYNKGECVQTNFPAAKGATKIEAESEARDVISDDALYMHNKDDNVKPQLVKLRNASNTFEIRGTVPQEGFYRFVLHYYQPNHPSFEAETIVQSDKFYSGVAKIEHCPNVVGCRAVFRNKENDQTFFQIGKEFIFTLRPSDYDLFLDYILVVDGTINDEHVGKLLTSSRSDESKDIMAGCVQPNFYVNPENTSDYCRSVIFSTTVDFNGGALPCQCNIDGSSDYKCKPFGGQCNCKPNVIGRDCSVCKTGYYGFPNCRKCNCPSTAVCHPKTGDCICPKGVTGENCDSCLPFTYGFDSIVGCDDCNCNSKGVENHNLNCDLYQGQCNCKKNIVGRKCDACKPGFFSFPSCQLCRCDARGTTEQICDQKTANCFCKPNVDGVQCDRCKADSYYLQENNPQGCTKCFCFGNTDRCVSSSMTVVQVSTDDKDWNVFNITIKGKTLDARRLEKNQDYGLSFTEGKHQISPNVLSEGDAQQLYISLPKEYLGNKITAYGLAFEYRISNNVFKLKNQKAIISPDLILIGSNNISIIHDHLEQPLINEEFHLSIRLLENEFYHLDGNVVAREEFMMVLVDLQAIYLRVKMFDPIDDITLQAVQMSVGIPGNRFSTAIKAKSVEHCDCPPNFKGSSCEDCAQGYYRNQTGPYRGDCVRCNCHGHSNECDPVTGKCFNCKHNTEGDHCEKCIEGYHGDGTRGNPHDCIICACPLPITSNNFATSCEMSPSGRVLTCNCRPGYNGTRCDTCAAGHFGQPQIQGRLCRQCECNGNIDVNDPGSCDAVSGVCTNCLNNSTGEHCERCADWFHGNSIAQTCQDCSCNQCGSEFCNHETGECKCKNEVVGKDCDKCAPGHYGFKACRGCDQCRCNPEGSKDSNCNDDDGQCDCKEGVDGRTCEKCKTGFWGFGKHGCQSCMCNAKFARALQCNQITGQCQCLPGVMGEKCEKCPDRWVLIPESGCQECENCIHVLLNDMDELHSMIGLIENDVKDTSSEALAFKKLRNVKERRDNQSLALEETFGKSEARNQKMKQFLLIKDNIKTLEGNMTKADFKSEEISQSVVRTNQKVLALHNSSLNLENNVKVMRQFLGQVIENIIQQNQDQTNITNVDLEVNERNSEHALEEVKEIDNRTQAVSEKLAEEFDAFEGTLGHAQQFAAPTKDLNRSIFNTLKRLSNMTNLVIDMKNYTQKAREDTINAENIFKKKMIESIVERVDIIKNASDDISKNLRDSANFNEDQQRIGQSLISMGEDILQLDKNLNQSTGKLNTFKTERGNEYTDLIAVKEDVLEHTRNIKAQANYLVELFETTKNLADDPMKAANVYNNISDFVDQSKLLLGEVSEILGTPNRRTEVGEVSEAVKQVSDEVNKSNLKLDETKVNITRLETINENLTNQMERNEKEYLNIKEKTDNIEGAVQSPNEDHQTIQTSEREVSASDKKADELIGSIKSLIDETETIKDYSNFLRDVKESDDYMKRFEKELSTNKTDKISENIDAQQNQFKKLKESVDEKLAQLKQQIHKVKHTLNNVQVGMEFYPNSSLELNNPLNLAESSTYNHFAMQFLAKSPNGMLAYIGNVQQPAKRASEERRYRKSDYLSLELRDGNVVLTINLGSGAENILTDSKNVVDNKWHRVVVERTGKLVKLAVYNMADKDAKPSTLEVKGEHTILNLDRFHSKVFIGGTPANYELHPNVLNRHFVGLISNVMLDHEPIGLWNLKSADHISGAPAYSLFSENSLRFNGNGYAIIQRPKTDISESMFMSISFKTYAKDGLIFLIGDPSMKDYQSIEINKGQIVLLYELGSGLTKVRTVNTYNDGKWHMITVNREAKEVMLKVDNENEINGFADGMSVDLSVTDDNIYVGGFPGMHSFYDVMKEGFDGCIKELQINQDYVSLYNNKDSAGVTPGCSSDFIRLVSFSEQMKDTSGFVAHALNATQADNIQLIFKFRTLSKVGLLLLFSGSEEVVAGQPKDAYISLSLDEGTLKLHMTNNVEILKTDYFFNDNRWHYVMLSIDKTNIKMSIDDQHNFHQKLSEEFKNIYDTLFIGGLPSSLKRKLGGNGQSHLAQLIGCVGDISLGVRFLNLADASTKHNVKFSKCSLSQNDDDVVVGNRPISPNDPFTKKPALEYQPPVGGCALPPVPKEEAFSSNMNLNMAELRFGSTFWSRYEFDLSTETTNSLSAESGFQLSFKTMQANGVLFFMGSNSVDFIGLYFLNNQLHYSFDCGSGRGVVAFTNNYSDNQWHTVTFSRKDSKGLVRVDDELREFDSTGSAKMLNVISPIYVGGVNPQISPSVKNHLKSVLSHATPDGSHSTSASFAGCLRDLKVSGVDYKFSQGQGYEVAPCSENVESGHFFHYDGGYLHYADEFKVQYTFKLVMEIKPRTPSGILVAAFGQNDYLVVYFDNGKVKLAVDNGKSPINAMVDVKKPLCDGSWHKITVSKANNVVTLSVDDLEPVMTFGKAGISSTDTRGPLYIGGMSSGVKEEKKAIFNSVLDNFVGCMRIKEINEAQNVSQFSRIEGHVILNSCFTN